MAAKAEQSKHKSEIGEMRQNDEESSKAAEAAEEELKKAKLEFDEELVSLKREHENKVK